MRAFALALALAAAAATADFVLAGVAATAEPILAQPPPQSVRLADLSWPEAENALRPDTVVVIPLGAAAKEHGPHLKLSNDFLLAEYLAKRVAASTHIVLAPPLNYHFYPAFLEYPGSTSLTIDTARMLTAEVVRTLARFGPRRFYVLNTGISTARALAPAAAGLAADGILLGYTELGPRLDQASARVRQQEGGTHADEIETSMMLYINPGAVDMTRAVKDYTPSAGPLRLTRTLGAPGTYSPSGVWGDATLATPEKGRVIVEALVAGILQDIEALRRAPLPAASRAGGSRGVAPGPPAAPQPPRGCTPADDRAIRALADGFSLHWSNADAVSLANMWADEGDMIHPDGRIERTRETIRSNRAQLFTQREYRGSRHPVTLSMVRCLGASVAVADGKWELRGLSDAAGKILPPFEGQVTLVVRSGGAGWQIEAWRYTQKPAAAPMPTLLRKPGFIGGQ